MRILLLPPGCFFLLYFPAVTDKLESHTIQIISCIYLRYGWVLYLLLLQDVEKCQKLLKLYSTTTIFYFAFIFDDKFISHHHHRLWNNYQFEISIFQQTKFSKSKFSF